VTEDALGRDRLGELLDVYDEAVPQVYGYLVRRCPTDALAEDLTAETFLAAVDACRRGTVTRPTPAWLVTIARNKLVDHWRRVAREERGLRLAAEDATTDASEWESALDEQRVLATLDRLGPHHQAALTLRYLDNLSVPEVAEYLGRTVHATEALLVRARSAFRKQYAAHDQAGGGTGG